VWEHGDLEFRKYVGDELNLKMGVPFPHMIKLKCGKTMFFSWIVFKSRVHCDCVKAKVMKNPRLANMDLKSMPFDVKHMSFGGFKILVGV
jgi:uncharacterized protein YbaA (DUF1428 family)